MAENGFDFSVFGELIAKLKDTPKFEKWNEFPPEIKMECIKTMDFKMRSLLRYTSRTERALVDSLKDNDKHILSHVNLNYKKFEIIGQSLKGQRIGDKLTFNYRYVNGVVNERMINFIPHILNTYHIDYFYLLKEASLGERALSKMEKLIPNESIRVRHVTLESQDIQTMAFFLKKFSANLNSITLELYYKEIPFKWYRELFENPSMINVKKLSIHGICGDVAIEIIRLWRQIDLKVGSQFCCHLLNDWIENNFELAYSEYTKGEIVSCINGKLRVTTNFPNKHLLIMAEENKYLHCAVIPADDDGSVIGKYIKSVYSW